MNCKSQSLNWSGDDVTRIVNWEERERERKWNAKQHVGKRMKMVIVSWWMFENRKNTRNRKSLTFLRFRFSKRMFNDRYYHERTKTKRRKKRTTSTRKREEKKSTNEFLHLYQMKKKKKINSCCKLAFIVVVDDDDVRSFYFSAITVEAKR